MRYPYFSEYLSAPFTSFFVVVVLAYFSIRREGAWWSKAVTIYLHRHIDRYLIKDFFVVVKKKMLSYNVRYYGLESFSLRRFLLFGRAGSTRRTKGRKKKKTNFAKFG